ncbi:MAG: CAP domain-containing protein [Deltaproteobacteria bacterium]|nr:MAG: CAP domain-containing protein [Deltaproteobacteria bacterium]
MAAIAGISPRPLTRARRAGLALTAALAGLWACAGDITEDPPRPVADAGSGGAADAAPGQGGGADASPGSAPLSSEERALFDTINAERVARGLAAVELRDDLVCAAARHSMDIGTTGECTHTGSDGSSPTDRVAACGGPGWSGEIVACGQSTPRAAVDAWIGSPGHNMILFDPGQRRVGVAMHNHFWTAIFDR